VLIRRSILISAGKLYRGPLGIARKPHAWRFSGIREYCLDPRRRLGNAALHLYHSYAQHCWRVQRISGEVFLGSFAGTRAYCLLALACRRSVFEVLCRNLLLCLFSLEQHQTGRQKLRRQQRSHVIATMALQWTVFCIILFSQKAMISPFRARSRPRPMPASAKVAPGPL
jgi:hypothetical protein